MSNILSNLETVNQQIQKAAISVNRDPSEIILIAVTKNHTSYEILELAKGNIKEIGENKVQELQTKFGDLGSIFNIHFIGRLQTNKVRQLLPMVSYIHSVDSVKLAQFINKEAERVQKVINILIQVNTSNEPQKGGVEPDKLIESLHQIKNLTNIKVNGLMTMAMDSDNSEEVRGCFKLLASLRKRVQSENILGIDMQHLSMGMSGDFEIAVEEGATLVRVGSALFK